MARRTISYPDEMEEWITKQIDDEEFEGYSHAFQTAMKKLREEYETDHTSDHTTDHTTDHTVHTPDHTPDHTEYEESVIERVRELEERVSRLEEQTGFVSDDKIKTAVNQIDWSLDDLDDTEERRTAISEAAIALRDHGQMEMGEMRKSAADIDLAEGSKNKILRQIRQLRWVDHKGGKVYYWR